MSQLQIALDGQSLITPQAITTELSSSKTHLHDEQLPVAKGELAIVMRIATQRIEEGGNPAEAVKWLIGALHDLRRKFEPSIWQELIPIVQAHSSAKVFQQCPFTRWSFEKPRGYSGDASLIDFIYGHPAVDHEVAKCTQLGLDIYEYTRNAPGPVAVRERRDILTRYVDELAAEKGEDFEILTVAAGHLREADTSVALKEGRIKRWVALDQDPISIGSITRDFQGTVVEAIDGSVRGLLSKKHKLGTFDFIYAAGLYDYLNDKVAIKLTQTCMNMLKPGGVFLFANFAEGMADDGYMESYMNWVLLQRSEADMWNVINSSVERNGVDAEVWFGENRNIVYGTIRKHG
ncbi:MULTISPECIES: class I SAM-dependent methyltransferase [unclassified Rhizobium]|uniref:class I SAM-dependent methyltransferase n=1 Tax=unclassified Rhizobium TaxID=2613769 RepID=UPI0006F6E21F|nr:MULTISPECIES: class I SAM-dependent methyltransferase [unclassified Rhizobium]KQV43404.1 methyltransferase [Rhizobium sp. Root1212]KRD37589.1 methyltransferase [Rhizobium sp. Root268]